MWGLGKDDVVLTDRAYLDFSFLGDLNERGVFFVVTKRKIAPAPMGVGDPRGRLSYPTQITGYSILVLGIC